MKASVTSELRKATTTRLWWILLALMVATIAFFAGVFAFALAFGDASTGTSGQELVLSARDMALTVYTLGVTLGYAFPLAFGAILMTGEFRHRTLATTLLAQPSRGRLVVGKLLAALPFAALYGAASSLAAVGVGAAALALSGQPTMLDDPDILRSAGLAAIAMATWMIVGVGFGSVLTNQVAAIVTVLGWTQLVEPILRLALGFWEPVAPLARFLPGAAGEAIAGGSLYSAAGLSDLLPAWAGLLVLLAYGAAAAGIGWLTTLRRDVA